MMPKGVILLALILILVGTYSLLIQFEVAVPGLDQLWPIFPFVGGLFLLGNYLRGERREHSQVLWGTASMLSGLFFFLITLSDQDYSVLQIWWPVFVAIGGISFLSHWLAQGLRDWGSLFLAVVGLVFSGAALTINLRPELAPGLIDLWPVGLILIGLMLLARGIFTTRQAQ
jgi:hypothetical protein